MGAISETIRQKRRKLEISQEDMAKRVGMSRVRYISFEKGRLKFTEDELLGILLALDLEIKITEK